MGNKSIRYYYFTSIATVLVASVLVMGVIQTGMASGYFREEKEAGLEQVITGVSTGIRSGQIRPGDDSLYTIEYMAKIAGIGVFLTNQTGQVVYSTSEFALPTGMQVPSSVLREIDQKGSLSELGRLGGFYRTNFYTMAVPLTDENGFFSGYIIASADASGLRVYLSDMMSGFVLSAAVVLFVSSLLALVLTTRTVIPIRRVSAAARRFGEGDYSARVPVTGDDELAQLAITFNEMANSFEATDVSRRSFMGNIAHELRTPMTSIKGFIDGMLDGTIPLDQRDKYLTIVSEEVGRLARLTSNMLDISKLEAGEYVPKTAVFDVWSPLTSVCLSAMQRLEEGNIEVRGLEDNAPVMVMADEDFVHQVSFNLLDNAIKFAGENGAVELEVTTTKTMATVCIRNTGSGISEEDISQVFERFYKADKSRGTNRGGSGLGLHICKVLVGLMGGRIWASSEQEGWTEFCFTLPLAPKKQAAAAKK